jgi:hypothetical protein
MKNRILILISCGAALTVLACSSLKEVRGRLDEKPTISVNSVTVAAVGEGRHKMPLPATHDGIYKAILETIKSDWPSDKVTANDPKADLQFNVYGRIRLDRQDQYAISLTTEFNIRDQKNNKWLVTLPTKMAIIDLPAGSQPDGAGTPELVQNLKVETIKGLKNWLAEVKTAQ